MSAPKVAVVVCNRFSPFHIAVPCIIFGKVLPERDLFELALCAAEAGELRSRERLFVDAPYDLQGLRRADLIVVPYWRDPAERPAPALLEALRAAYQGGSQIVGLCLGTYVLAYAGLLKHHRASTHWEFEQDFIGRFPEVQLDSNALYVDDRRLITSAGTAAGLDCCLYLVRQQYGSAIANKIARRMVIPPYREGGQAQFIEHPVPVSTRDNNINALLDYLRAHLPESHPLDELASRARMSRRTFTRQFQKSTGMSVGEWLIQERLQRGQELLESTTLSVELVAEQAGFHSALSFRKHFRQRFNITPSEWRRAFQGI